MCKWGNTVRVRVPVSARLSYTGKFRWAFKEVDRCIAPIVKALNKAGIYTDSCCCGHGKRRGLIELTDGRQLIIAKGKR